MGEREDVASSIFFLVGKEVCACCGKVNPGRQTLLCGIGSGNHTPFQVVAHNHLLQLHNVRMAETQEQCDFTKAANGNACKQRCSVNATGATTHAFLQSGTVTASGRGYWQMWRVTMTSLGVGGAKGSGENVQFYSWPR